MPSEEKKPLQGRFYIKSRKKSGYGKVRDLIQDRVSSLSNLNRKLEFEISERKRAEAELEQRNKLLGTLLEVSNLVSTSTTGPKQLLMDILERLRKIVDFNGTKVFIVKGKHVELVAHMSPLSKEEEFPYYKQIDSFFSGIHLVTKGRPVVIDDIHGDDPLAASFRNTLSRYLDTALKKTRCWMGVPMLVNDRVIGILTLDHTEAGFYKKEHVELVQAFANQAALEYENARLYTETVKKADELKTMLNVQQAITSRLELATVLQLIADESRRLTLSASTAVCLVEGNDLFFSVYSGENFAGMMGRRISIDESELGKYLYYGSSVILKKDSAVTDERLKSIFGPDGSSYLIVPLLAGEKAIGMILAISNETDEFDEEDERILNMFASSAVIGIENARMYEDEKKRHQEDEKRRRVAEGLRDILAVLNSNKSLDEILDFIICQAAHLMGTDSGALYRLNEENGLLTLEASCGLPPEFHVNMNIPVGVGALGRAVVEKRPVVIDDIPSFVENARVRSDLKLQLDWLEENCNALLTVPLLGKDEVFGGIALYFKKPENMPSEKRHFSDEEVSLAVAFADQASLAIDNAKLKAQAEEMAVSAERSRLARDLHDAVTQTLFSASLIAEVLPRIWTKNPEEGRKRLEELRQLARGALAEMRTLLLELRPKTLVDAPLEELLRQLSEATTGRARIPVVLKINGHAEVPTEVKIALYRIAQEVLNNIAKHSGANNAELILEAADEPDNKVSLIVRDDGKGFDPSTVTGDHLGLDIMKERTEAIGASLTINSKIGQGTEITVSWKGE